MNKNIKEIIICLDDDKSGKYMSDNLSEKYSRKNYIISRQKTDNNIKGFNEELIEMMKKA